MQKTILITGSTDGIGFVTARMLVEKGHRVLIHGRNPQKLEKTKKELSGKAGKVESYMADLSRMQDVLGLADEIKNNHTRLDVLINNAGVLKIPNAIDEKGFDKRFTVNTIAPYLLTKELLTLLGKTGRVVNVSSAAQAPVNTDSLLGDFHLSHGNAYAQSKLALIMWSNYMTKELNVDGPMIVSLNPKSLLGTKMVKESYGIEGSDLRLGADILIRAAISAEFAQAHGKYFDNDIGRFSSPYPDALNSQLCKRVVDAIEESIRKLLS